MKYLKTLNESLRDVNLTSNSKLKNVVQVFNWSDINAQNSLRDQILKFYREDLNGSDTYVRYYPNDDSYIGEQLNKMINNYLVQDGYYFDLKDDMFYLLIRIDW